MTTADARELHEFAMDRCGPVANYLESLANLHLHEATYANLSTEMCKALYADVERELAIIRKWKLTYEGFRKEHLERLHNTEKGDIQ